MQEENAIKTFYSMLISGGSVLIVGACSFILNRLVKTTDENRIEAEKDLADFKEQAREQTKEFKKDIGEAFNRIRDLETRQAVIMTEYDMRCRGVKNGKE